MNYSVIRTWLTPDANVVLTTHKSPDGDAIGSIAGLYLFLKKLGLKKVNPVVPDAAPEFLDSLPGKQELCFFSDSEEEATKAIREAEVFIHLDFNTLSRVGEDMASVLRENTNAKTILIDHHQQPDEFDEMLSVTTASSTAELVYEFCKSLAPDTEIDLEIAANLYTGIITDTGSFRYSSTGANTHAIAAEFHKLGLNTAGIHQMIYDSSSFHRLKLIGYALSEKMEVFEDGKASLISLTQEELTSHNYIKGDTEGLVNYGLSMAGAEVTAFFKEAEVGSVKISFRSKNDVDVNQFARSFFNGGGHKNAAGGKVELPINEAIALYKENIAAWLSK